MAIISLFAALPTLANEVFQFKIQPGEAAPQKLVWQSQADYSYNLWFSTDLNAWSPVDGYPQQGTGGEMEYSFDPETFGLKGFFMVTGEPGGGSASEGFALIPAGTFEMGGQFGEEWDDELPVHTVNVSRFFMGKTEVTKEQWEQTYEWAVTHGYEFANSGGGKGQDHPVHTVNWYDVVKWCNARSEKEGLTACYRVAGTVYRTGQTVDVVCDWGANGYRLPTEAEWEKAARGGLEGKRFPWGDTISHQEANFDNYGGESYATGTLDAHPGYNDGSWPYTSPVGSFAPNGYGLYDVAGNMWEWCWDWYQDGYYSRSPATDPRGGLAGPSRVLRGGSWASYARGSRVSGRNGFRPDSGGANGGFRLARGRL